VKVEVWFTRQTSHFIRQTSVLSKRQIESSFELEFKRRGARQDSRHAVIAQAGGSAEYKRVAGLERNGLEGVAPLQATELEAGGVADRNRHDRQTGGK